MNRSRLGSAALLTILMLGMSPAHAEIDLGLQLGWTHISSTAEDNGLRSGPVLFGGFVDVPVAAWKRTEFGIEAAASATIASGEAQTTSEWTLATGSVQVRARTQGRFFGQLGVGLLRERLMVTGDPVVSDAATGLTLSGGVGYRTTWGSTIGLRIQQIETDVTSFGITLQTGGSQ